MTFFMRTKSKKSKLKKTVSRKVKKVFAESEVLIVLEEMNDSMKILAEGQIMLSGRMDNLESRFDGLESEVRQGFSLIMDFLKRLDEELMGIKKDVEEAKEKKVDLNIYEMLEKRMAVAERQIERMKSVLKEKNIKI